MSARNCPSCGAPTAIHATECRYCGEQLSVPNVSTATSHIPESPQYEQQQFIQVHTQTAVYTPKKSRTVAAVLAIILGGLGIHKFYLGSIVMGIVYLLLCWTYIPVVVGIIEGVIYLSSSEEQFQRKYVK